MRASKQLSWTELRVGLFVLMALGMGSVFVFYITQAGRVFAREASYVTYLPDAAGLEEGSPVRLVGFVVGTVESVGLSEFRDDPSRHAKVVFRVRRDYAEDIRSDSEAFVTTEGLLGQSVLELTRGMAGEPIAPRRRGARLAARQPQADRRQPRAADGGDPPARGRHPQRPQEVPQHENQHLLEAGRWKLEAGRAGSLEA